MLLLLCPSSHNINIGGLISDSAGTSTKVIYAVVAVTFVAVVMLLLLSPSSHNVYIGASTNKIHGAVTVNVPTVAFFESLLLLNCYCCFVAHFRLVDLSLAETVSVIVVLAVVVIVFT